MALVSEDRIVEQLFLSPRVVDAATFEELAGSLRSLAVHAGEQQTKLSDTLKQSDIQRACVDEALTKLQASLAPAARLVPTLDDRILQARQAAERLTDPEALLGPTLETVTQAATQRCADAVREQSEMFEAERSRLSEICSGLVDAQVDRLELLVADLEERAARAEQRMVSAESVLARGVQAAEASAEAMVSQAVRTKIEHAVEQAIGTTISSTLEPMVEAAQGRITQSVGDCLEAIAAASKRAQQIGSDCTTSAATLETTLETKTSDTLKELTERIDAELERAHNELAAASEALPKHVEQRRVEATTRADDLHSTLLARLNATAVDSTQLCDRVEDSLTGLEARAGSIANRLAGRIDDLAADADMLAQDAKRQVEAASDASIALTPSTAPSTVEKRTPAKASSSKAPAATPAKATKASPTKPTRAANKKKAALDATTAVSKPKKPARTQHA